MDSLVDWAELEFAPWRGVRPGDLIERLRAFASHWPNVYMFEPVDGMLAPIAKPGADPMLVGRTESYRDYLAAVLHDAEIRPTAPIAIGLHDVGAPHLDLPLFEFQKVRGSGTMLLPDVDLLAMDFMDDADCIDPIAFEDKRDAAIFVGATTGTIITAAMVTRLSHPRLRAAAFFRDKPGVTFELPVIVQCDSPETEALIAALDLGQQRRGWAEQLSYRYLLSMDGNGATCSRVARSLVSNGVLVKYASPHELFYFRGLQAWRHYLPVRRDEDVLTILAQSDAARERDHAIARRSAAFARDHLSREACGRYTAALLRRYFEWIG